MALEKKCPPSLLRARFWLVYDPSETFSPVVVFIWPSVNLIRQNKEA